MSTRNQPKDRTQAIVTAFFVLAVLIGCAEKKTTEDTALSRDTTARGDSVISSPVTLSRMDCPVDTTGNGPDFRMRYEGFGMVIASDSLYCRVDHDEESSISYSIIMPTLVSYDGELWAGMTPATITDRLSPEHVFSEPDLLELGRCREEADEDREEWSASTEGAYNVGCVLDSIVQINYYIALYGGGRTRTLMRSRVFNIRTGERLDPERLFIPDSIESIVSQARRRIRTDIEWMVANNYEMDEWQFRNDSGEFRTFDRENLIDMRISPDSLYFYLDIPWPVKWPDNAATAGFSWEEVRRWLVPGGPFEEVGSAQE